MAELEGKAALVTGAGVGIGRAIAIKLALEGARVLVVDLNEATAQETVETIQTSRHQFALGQASSETSSAYHTAAGSSGQNSP